MGQDERRGNDYLVRVRREPEGFEWIVEHDERRALSGPAPDPDSALRRGAFAAAALRSLDRISRRSF